MITNSRKSDPGARGGPASDRAGGARTCVGCGQPVKEDDRPVEYREVIGLQEWKSIYYHTACAPGDRVESDRPRGPKD
jgi:hypothetical protein